MARQRAAARKAWAGSGEAATEQVWFDLREKIGATDFLGYATEVAEGQILAHRQGRQIGRRMPRPGMTVVLIANQTPFYGESGGQMGDSGDLHRRPRRRDRHRRHPEEAGRHVRA